MLVRVAVAAVAALALAARGLRKQSLSRGGAAAAGVVGFASLACLPRSGIAMVAFYLSSSRLTRMSAGVKQALDADYKAGGQRGASQVLSCSLLSSALAVAHLALVPGGDGPVFAGDAAPLHAALLLGTTAHFACCAADTWASEVGVLSAGEPLLVTQPWRRVPRGTNGGVSALGLAASLAGGGFVGLVVWLTGPPLFAAPSASLAQDWQLVPLGMAFGLAGSLLDSLLGATLQETLFDEERRCIRSYPTKGSTWLPS